MLSVVCTPVSSRTSVSFASPLLRDVDDIPASSLPLVEADLEVSHVRVAEARQRVGTERGTLASRAEQDHPRVSRHEVFVVLRLGISPELEHPLGHVPRPRDRSLPPALAYVSDVDQYRGAFAPLRLELSHREVLDPPLRLRDHLPHGGHQRSLAQT